MGTTINRKAGDGKLLVSSLAMALCAAAGAQETGSHAQCAQLEDPQARLECYDAASARQQPPPTASKPVEAVPVHEPMDPEPGREPAVVQEQAAPLSDSVGEEQLESKDRSDAGSASFRGTVTKCQKGATGKWYFYFDNGQVWQQKDNDRLNLSDCNFEAKISKDFFGYKMEIPGSSNKVRIGRVK